MFTVYTALISFYSTFLVYCCVECALTDTYTYRLELAIFSIEEAECSNRLNIVLKKKDQPVVSFEHFSLSPLFLNYASPNMKYIL